MKFVTKLLLSLIPLILFAMGLVTVLVLRNGNSIIWDLQVRNNELELEFFVQRARQAQATLDTLMVSEIEFYRSNAERQVLNYGLNRKVPGGFLYALGAQGQLLFPTGRSFEGHLLLEEVFAPWNWTLGVAVSEEHLSNFAMESIGDSILVLILVLIPAIILSFVLARAVSRPIAELKKGADTLAAGELGARVSTGSRDELGYLAAAFNIMAESLESLTSDLEDQVRMRTAELEASLKELKETQEQLVRKERIANMGVVVAGVAHEINTPLGNSLTGVTYQIESLRAALVKVMGEGIKKSELEQTLHGSLEAGEIIRHNLHKASELISRFKQLAIEQGGDGRRFFLLNEVVDEAIELSIGQDIPGNVSLKLDIPADLALNSYPRDFARIFQQLLSNSLDHGFADGHEGEIKISASRTGDSVEIRYQDNGLGLTPDIAEHIFDPFFTTRPRGQHSGLGLNIVFNTIHGNLNGSIQVESSPGDGLRYLIRIPDQPAPGEIPWSPT